MTRPAFHSPTALTAPDVPGAVFDFITAFVDPPLTDVRRGYQNRAALPKGPNDLAIITVLSETRRGTNVHDFVVSDGDEDGAHVTRRLTLCDVQVDVWSETPERAKTAASLLELWARDEAGVRFFNERGLSVIGADAPRDLTFVDESRQYAPRFMITLHLEYWASASAAIPYFDAVDVGLVNVDVKYPPEQE